MFDEFFTILRMILGYNFFPPTWKKRIKQIRNHSHVEREMVWAVASGVRGGKQ